MKQTYTIMTCKCPVCRFVLGTKQSNETSVFTNDAECGWDWMFYPNNDVPVALARVKKGKRCDCGGCKARDGR